jgi:HEAT repeat protein
MFESQADSSSTTDPPQPERDFPHVEPPTTSFFVQLFVMPALIVCGIMLGWFLLDRFAGRRRPVEEYLAIIGSDRRDRWAAAHDLYLILSRNGSYAADEQLAGRIAEQLDRALSATPCDEPYASYLAGALGWFQSPVGVDVLNRACQREHPKLVRESALFALSRLAHRLGAIAHETVARDVAEYLQTDPDASIRERCAYFFSHACDRRGESALENALNDSVATVRYNAANALARLGNPASLPTLIEMLDEDALAAHFIVRTAHGETQQDRGAARITLDSALQSIRALRRANRQADVSKVMAALQRLSARAAPEIGRRADELLRELQADEAASAR